MSTPKPSIHSYVSRDAGETVGAEARVALLTHIVAHPTHASSLYEATGAQTYPQVCSQCVLCHPSLISSISVADTTLFSRSQRFEVAGVSSYVYLHMLIIRELFISPTVYMYIYKKNSMV